LEKTHVEYKAIEAKITKWVSAVSEQIQADRAK
jgi:hypothetical protein